MSKKQWKAYQVRLSFKHANHPIVKIVPASTTGIVIAKSTAEALKVARKPWEDQKNDKVTITTTHKILPSSFILKTNET